MLCDELQLDYNDAGPTLARIQAARKFVLSADFAAAADGLLDNLKELERIVPYCRLPYPSCWFELAHADRPHFVGSERPMNEFEHKPKRIGFLLNALNDNLGSWKAEMFWSFQHPPQPGLLPYSGSLLAMLFDSGGKAYELSRQQMQRRLQALGSQLAVPNVRYPSDPLGGVLENAFRTTLADFGLDLVAMAQAHGVLEQLMNTCIGDWGGEARFLVSMLGLLNTRNVVQLETVDNTEWNRKRAKHGQHPLHSHHIIKVAHTILRRSRGTSEAETRAAIRAHLVRGHFKRRSSGIFWWNPFLRGRLDKGFVSKDYELKQGAKQ